MSPAPSCPSTAASSWAERRQDAPGALRHNPSRFVPARPRVRPANRRPDTEEKRSITVSDDNFERFKQCAVEVLSVEADQVIPEASFADDLDADSLDLVELVMALEEEFGVNVEEEELEGITTIGAAYELITGKL